MKNLIGALPVAVAIPVARWLLINWWVLLTLALAAAGFGGVWLYRKAEHARWDRTRVNALRFNLPQIDALHHREFAYAVRDLLRRDGCSNARQVGGNCGDNGADVIATDPYGRVWVIQCKHRRNGTSGSAIGTPTSSASTAPPARFTAPTWSPSSPTAASPAGAPNSPTPCTCTS